MAMLKPGSVYAPFNAAFSRVTSTISASGPRRAQAMRAGHRITPIDQTRETTIPCEWLAIMIHGFGERCQSYAHRPPVCRAAQHSIKPSTAIRPDSLAWQLARKLHPVARLRQT
jgi:hypothetical protein